MRTIEQDRNRSRSIRAAAFALPILGFGFVLAVWVTSDSPSNRVQSDDPMATIGSDRVAPESGAVTGGWEGRVATTLQALEYRVTEATDGPQAPNRSQNLRTHFRSGGVEIVPRSAASPGWSWAWQTRAWGRGSTMERLTATEPSIETYRVEYRHPGFVEWYENGPGGIEQGFLLDRRPDGEGPLVVEGAWTGNLRAVVSSPGETVEFETASGVRVLRYDELVVTDAEGDELLASVEIEGERLFLRIEDEGATYPLLIDPILTTPDWVWEPNQTDADFGHSVCTAGDVNGDGFSDLIVGAMRYDAGNSNEGAAMVFHGSADGFGTGYDWFGDSDQQNALYGSSVSCAGDVNGDGYDDVIVGSHFYDNPEAEEGRVWLYYGSEDGLPYDADWTGERNQTNSMFSFSVSGAGDVNGDGYTDFIVGAPSFTNGQTREGCAFVYYGSAGGPTGPWIGESNDDNSNYGWSVSGAGDVNGDGYDDVVVGAYGADAGGAHGKVFVYFGRATGLPATADWTWTPADYEYFGWSVAGAGDVNGDGYADILVGAPGWGDDAVQEGHAYLFYGGAGGPDATPDWEYFGDVMNARFGDCVATAGDVNADGFADVIIGAESYTNDEFEEGRAYLFLGSHFGLTTEPVWVTEGDQAESMYGGAVGTAGDINGDGYSEVVIGAEWYDNPSVAEGRAYVFNGSPSGPRETAGWVTESNQTQADYGYALASAGDVNADGFDDVLVGAKDFDNGQVDEGAVFLFLGSDSGIQALPVWYAEGNQAFAGFGVCVASAGDVNGDGLEDILVGAFGYDNNYADEGAAFLWYGSTGGAPPGTPANADWDAYGDQSDARFGFSVASAGDVNADGFADVIVGAYNYDDTRTNEGAVFIYHGSEAGLSDSEDWFHACQHTGAQYGVSVSSAGDFNGDGYSDVIVGSYLYDHPTTGEGAAFVYLGSADGVLPGAPFWYAESDQADAQFGYSVACAGDVNGDGYSDVIIGAPYMDGSYVNGGRAFLWHGASSFASSGAPGNEDWSATRAQNGANLGWSVASAGDVNGDGFSDVLIGCPRNTAPGGVANGGAAFLWIGSPDGIVSGAAYWMAVGTQTGCDFGWRVATARDVNGDGYSDVLVGSPSWDQGSDGEGRSFLYYGNDSRGLARSPSQWRVDLTGPIAPFGMADHPSAFILAARGRSAAGRARVRMLTEVDPYPSAFDGAGIQRSVWMRTAAPVDPGGSYSLMATLAYGLTEETQYKWRMRFECKNPLFPRTPWFHLSGNGPGEADLRMPMGSSSVPPTLARAGLRLSACAPNPFADRTSFEWILPAEREVHLGVFDVRGRRVRVLAEGLHPAGIHRSDWDGRADDGTPLAAGVYWVRLAAEDGMATQKVVRIE